MPRRKDRVLNRLSRALERAEDDGWVCMRRLTHPTVGGNRAAARIHELRADGVELDRKFPCDCTDCRHFARKARERGESPSRLTAWRLARARITDRQGVLL